MNVDVVVQQEPRYLCEPGVDRQPSESPALVVNAENGSHKAGIRLANESFRIQCIARQSPKPRRLVAKDADFALIEQMPQHDVAIAAESFCDLFGQWRAFSPGSMNNLVQSGKDASFGGLPRRVKVFPSGRPGRVI
jgi:hypothetical protein